MATASTKSRGVTTPGEVAAAAEFIGDASGKLGKAVDTLKRHIDTLEQEAKELEAQLKDEQAAHANDTADWKEKYTREIGARDIKIAAHEEKLRKVQATLA